MIALDAKLNFDDNALFRHPDDRDAARRQRGDPARRRGVASYGLNYIKLDGNVGCMVNGAGLAMATMDIVKLAGGEPANFLDVGGGASPEQIENAFRILSSDPSVKAVFINVFGGILRVRPARRGHHRRGQEARPQAPGGRADGGHQRRAGQEDAGRVGPQLDHGRRHGGGRARRRWRWPGGARR